jgi:hypothetical protein
MARQVPSAADFLFNEARYAVQDIRQKLFEQAWFGRVVTAKPVTEVFLNQEQQSNFDRAWGTASPDQTREQDRAPPSQEIDR